MPYVLLGNSFLSRFQMRRENDVLRLETRDSLVATGHGKATVRAKTRQPSAQAKDRARKRGCSPAGLGDNARWT